MDKGRPIQNPLQSLVKKPVPKKSKGIKVKVPVEKTIRKREKDSDFKKDEFGYDEDEGEEEEEDDVMDEDEIQQQAIGRPYQEESSPPKIKVIDRRKEGFNRDAFFQRVLAKSKQFERTIEPTQSSPSKPAQPKSKEKRKVTTNALKRLKKKKQMEQTQTQPKPTTTTEDEEILADILDEPMDAKPATSAKETKTMKEKPTPASKQKISLKRVKSKKKPKEVKEAEQVIMRIPSERVMIEDRPLKDRLPRRKTSNAGNDAVGVPHIRLPAYFQNNREKFIQFINRAFKPYQDELRDTDKELTCEGRSDDDDGFFTLMTHQKIVRDYITNYTPYRGLLLYHGLGSGKTCSSITIAESLKTNRNVIVMTPASLRTNYMEELKKCGDPLYKKQQYWEFVSTKGHPEWITPLSQTLGLTESFIRRQRGVWLVDAKKEPNFETLETTDQKSLDTQLNKMIQSKYQFISYNGITSKKLKELSNDGELNIFDNRVVVVDEVHNFVSRIVNKIEKKGSETNVAVRLYNMLLSAFNCRIVFLSGTPIINYPNELAVLFNMLRGYITTWNIPLNIKDTGKTRKVDESYIKQVFEKLYTTDYISYSPSQKVITITKNPFGFVNKQKKGEYRGVALDEHGEMTDDEFEKYIVKQLVKNDLEVAGGMRKIRVMKDKALPDTYETFKRYFLEENGKVKNHNLFKRRILGLTSYYKSAQEQLMPEFEKTRDTKVVELPMSTYQFGIYEKARQAERKEEENTGKQKKKQVDIYRDIQSSYRVFSRAFCNFVFPEDIQRPMPRDDSTTAEQEENELYELLDEENTDEQLMEGDQTYKGRIQSKLEQLKMRTDDLIISSNEDGEISRKEGLGKYSPKFATIIMNILSDERVGNHLIYSQFRAVEGIELLTIAMNANGFTPFKIKRTKGVWELDVNRTDVEEGKPMYALYTGTEGTDEREIIRNIYNSNWDNVPSSLIAELSELRNIEYKNTYGDIIKVFMITSSGAEGISLKNTRYVHIVEPHWHPVRIEQVIGRARRICSHQDLPAELRTVEVFIYLMKVPKEFLKEGSLIKMKLRDVSRLDGKTVLSSDEYLYEISRIKEEVNQELLGSIKSSAMDCLLHSSEGVSCMTFGDALPDTFTYKPSIQKEQRDEIRSINTKTIKWNAKKIKLDGNTYVLRTDTNEVYNYDSYLEAKKTAGMNPVKIGTLRKTEKGYVVE